jgi:hypothetical protein
MIYRASNPPLVRFAEPETGGEAYIPRRGIPAAQGLALANTAASWYGGAVMGGGGGGGRIAVEIRFSGATDTAFGSMFLALQQRGLIQVLSKVVKA